MGDKYILDADGNPQQCDDILEWVRWFENAGQERIVAIDYVRPYRVSTVFLGLDHRFGEGPPLLYETMIFGGVFNGDDEYQTRSATRDEALQMHQAALMHARWLAEKGEGQK